MIGAITPPSAPAKRSELQEAAAKFEAVFVRQMLGEMRKAKLADDIFGSDATVSFREQADAQLAEAMGKLGALGIGKLVEQQLGKAK